MTSSILQQEEHQHDDDDDDDDAGRGDAGKQRDLRTDDGGFISLSFFFSVMRCI